MQYIHFKILRRHVMTYTHILHLNFSLHYYSSYWLCLMSSHVCFYTASATVCMSACVFFRKQLHFTNRSLLFTQHVLHILRDVQSTRIDKLSSYEQHIPVQHSFNKVTKEKTYLPIGEFLFEFEYSNSITMTTRSNRRYEQE